MKKTFTTFMLFFVLYSYNVTCTALELDAFFINTNNLPSKDINKSKSLPAFKKLTSAKLSELIHAVFIVKGYGTNRQGETDIELDIRIISPSKKVLLAQEKFSIMKIKREKDLFVVIDPILDFMIETGDELGTYYISSRIIDSVSKDAKVKNISINIMQ
ncbi:MAG: hypothetical protein GY936_06030 [Ignavibacteriae bacterium]|nr:hypothetical protein [Ignavibacteriota bacterium]